MHTPSHNNTDDFTPILFSAKLKPGSKRFPDLDPQMKLQNQLVS